MLWEGPRISSLMDSYHVYCPRDKRDETMPEGDHCSRNACRIALGQEPVTRGLMKGFVAVSLCLLVVAFLQSECLGDSEKVWVTTGEGKEVPGYRFFPEKSSSLKLPGVVVAANVGGAKLVQYHAYCRNLADHDFSVLLIDGTNFPDYLTPGPQTWRRMPYHLWAWATHILIAARLSLGHEWYLETIQAAVDHLVGDPRVDTRKIALSGFSQSANAALALASRDNRVKALIWNNGGWPWIMPYNPEKLPPVLIFHGEQDGVYNVKYARSLSSELITAKCDCECYIYPGQRHMFNVYFDLDKEGDGANPVLSSSLLRLVAFLNRVFTGTARYSHRESDGKGGM